MKKKTEPQESFSNIERQLAIEFLREHREKLLREKDRFIWEKNARPNQLPPKRFTKWVCIAGRGFGKTRMLTEFCRKKAFEMPGSHGVIVGRTAADVRDVIVEGGESSLLKISPPEFYPKYEPSKRRLTWPNGTTANLYSADEPDSLRGPQGHWGAGDELAAWSTKKDDTEAYDNFMLGVRLKYKGQEPQVMFATTPRPNKIVKALVEAAKKYNSGVVVVRGSTYENRANLAEKFFNEIITQYEGTRLGRQEIDGELLEDIPGQLWTPEMFDDIRVRRDSMPEMVRIVVAIDPSVSSTENSDECGIVVVGFGVDGLFYLLHDGSGVMSPSAWAREAIRLYHLWRADCIIGEKNNGGDLVETNLRTIDEYIPFRSVWASHGKAIRAQPIASLYEQKRVRHLLPTSLSVKATGFEKLETQYCGFTNEQYEGEGSPDRAEAAIWGLAEFVENGRTVARMFPDFRPERLRDGDGRLREGEAALHVWQTPQPKPWWPRWISAYPDRAESTAHWWYKEPSGRVWIYRELVMTGPPESFGVAIANASKEEIGAQRSIPVWMPEEAFAVQGTRTVAAGVSDGIKRALGEHKAFMFVHDAKEMEIEDQNKRTRAIESRLAQMPGGFLCVRALRGSKESASGWDIVNDLLKWKKEVPKAKQESPDWNKAIALSKTDIVAYTAYMAQFTAPTEKDTVVPLLMMDNSIKRLIQAMGGASSGENGKLADSITGSVLQSLRIGALASRENGTREPEEEFIARKMDLMPPEASPMSLQIQFERAKQEYKGAGNMGVSVHRVRAQPSLRVM
jgi:phage terminase large subunit-like protein